MVFFVQEEEAPPTVRKLFLCFLLGTDYVDCTDFSLFFPRNPRNPCLKSQHDVNHDRVLGQSPPKRLNKK